MYKLTFIKDVILEPKKLDQEKYIPHSPSFYHFKKIFKENNCIQTEGCEIFNLKTKNNAKHLYISTSKKILLLYYYYFNDTIPFRIVATDDLPNENFYSILFYSRVYPLHLTM